MSPAELAQYEDILNTLRGLEAKVAQQYRERQERFVAELGRVAQQQDEVLSLLREMNGTA